MAKARVAMDVGVTEQMIRKPDSVLALTCFDQAARVSAQKGGKIFSGDFWGAGLGVMVNDSMGNILTNFSGSLLGLDPAYASIFGSVGGVFAGTTGLFGGTPGKLTCNTMGNLWQNVLKLGINQLVPPVTINDMINTANTGVMPPGVTLTSELGLNIQRSVPLFNDVKLRVGSLPRAVIPNYTNSKSLDSVLRCSRVKTGPCP